MDQDRQTVRGQFAAPSRVVFLPSGSSTEAEPGTSLLEAARKAGVGLRADCGGQGTCGRCRVRLDLQAPVDSVGPVEEEALSPGDRSAGYRLACQARILGPVVVHVPSDSAERSQRLQLPDQNFDPPHDPPWTILDLTVEEPHGSLSDWECLSRALVHRGLPECRPAGVGPARRLGGLLREHAWSLRVGLADGVARWLLPPGSPALGLAVDLGTTKVAASLTDLDSGTVLATGAMMNPQTAYGEDVMTRIASAMERPERAAELAGCARGVVNELAANLCRAAGRSFSPEMITECVVVANTVMHHLFLGLDTRPLGLAPFTPALRDSLDCPAGELGLALHPDAMVHCPPNISGFVGSDHVAMLLASRVEERPGPILAVDIGTNTEISLVREGRATTCSASSGPAFEGAHIAFGMRAAQGAVERLRIEHGQVTARCVGDGPAVGLCGSGLLDAVAWLRRDGAVNRHGAFNAGHPLVRRGASGPEALIVPAERTLHGRDITVSRKDLGRIQLAKAAIRCGIEMLLKRCGVRVEEIVECVVAGAFGSYLDLSSALAVGLFPPIAPERFRQAGNAAGVGARMLLTSAGMRAQARRLARRTTHCELTGLPEFRAEYVRSLWL